MKKEIAEQMGNAVENEGSGRGRNKLTKHKERNSNKELRNSKNIDNHIKWRKDNKTKETRENIVIENKEIEFIENDGRKRGRRNIAKEWKMRWKK